MVEEKPKELGLTPDEWDDVYMLREKCTPEALGLTLRPTVRVDVSDFNLGAFYKDCNKDVDMTIERFKESLLFIQDNGLDIFKEDDPRYQSFKKAKVVVQLNKRNADGKPIIIFRPSLLDFENGKPGDFAISMAFVVETWIQKGESSFVGVNDLAGLSPLRFDKRFPRVALGTIRKFYPYRIRFVLGINAKTFVRVVVFPFLKLLLSKDFRERIFLLRVEELTKYGGIDEETIKLVLEHVEDAKKLRRLRGISTSGEDSVPDDKQKK